MAEAKSLELGRIRQGTAGQAVHLNAAHDEGRSNIDSNQHKAQHGQTANLGSSQAGQKHADCTSDMHKRAQSICVAMNQQAACSTHLAMKHEHGSD